MLLWVLEDYQVELIKLKTFISDITLEINNGIPPIVGIIIQGILVKQ